MRSYEGQFSDNRPLKRTREEKQRQLRELKETLASMKQSNSSPALRASIATKIKELEVELAAPPPPPRERRGAPYQESFGTGPRPPRRPRPPREL